MVDVARSIDEDRHGGCRGNVLTIAFVVPKCTTSVALAFLGRRTSEGKRRSFRRGHDGREIEDWRM